MREFPRSRAGHLPCRLYGAITLNSEVAFNNPRSTTAGNGRRLTTATRLGDTKLAEVMQRICGVAIDRENGEGDEITGCGFGPDYNMIPLNGR
jgi:hypothetical protein